MNKTLFALYFPIWIACAVAYVLLFWGRSPAFKRRWYRTAGVLFGTIIGGMLALFALPYWPMFVLVLVALIFMIWAGVFQARVCLSCGKVSQPDNLITAPKFCNRCGSRLE